jgi:hypothetical protein
MSPEGAQVQGPRTEAGRALLTERQTETFSDASLALASRLLRELLTEPSQRERIDALAAAANALFGLREHRPDLWRKTTSHDWTGRLIR